MGILICTGQCALHTDMQSMEVLETNLSIIKKIFVYEGNYVDQTALTSKMCTPILSLFLRFSSWIHSWSFFLSLNNFQGKMFFAFNNSPGCVWYVCMKKKTIWPPHCHICLFITSLPLMGDRCALFSKKLYIWNLFIPQVLRVVWGEKSFLYVQSASYGLWGCL